MWKLLAAIFCLFVGGSTSATLTATMPPAAPSPTPAAAERWVGSWASAQQIAEGRAALPSPIIADATLRQVVRLSLGGARIRIRLSNTFGTQALRVSAVRVALPSDPASARIDPATDRAVTFSGLAAVTIPAGADRLSDPVDLAVPPLGHVAVSFHLPAAPARQTVHAAARATSYVARGNRVGAADLPGARTVTRWYQLSGVEVSAPAGAGAIVAFGDSITDGFGVRPDTDQRWPDLLARRLQADPATRHLAVLNLGIGGNRVLHDGVGPSALARFERDVLGKAGVRFLILLEGVNDLGSAAGASRAQRRVLVEALTRAYGQMIERARARGITVIGATILPFGGSAYDRPGDADEEDRQAVNAWIRAPGNFDAVIDFDAATRDPARPAHLLPAYDSGDGLHPSLAGYRAMADAIALSLFQDAALAVARDPVQRPPPTRARGEAWPNRRPTPPRATTRSLPIRATSGW